MRPILRDVEAAEQKHLPAGNAKTLGCGVFFHEMR
jgi:hypothetical protein